MDENRGEQSKKNFASVATVIETGIIARTRKTRATTATARAWLLHPYHQPRMGCSVSKEEAVAVAKLTTNVKSAAKTLESITSHGVHLTKHPSYPARAPVINPSWDVPEPEYKPIEFTHAVVLANDRTVKPGGWADPPDARAIKEEIAARGSYCNGGKINFVDGIPRNPLGRTGMCGRGLLGKWGPNFAADPVVTRGKPGVPGAYQVVAIERGDTHHWALPGGMVEYRQTVSETVKREFTEEAGNVPEEIRPKVMAQIEQLFSQKGNVVYCGYVDDPRNTDNSWMETTAVHFHCPDDLGQAIVLGAGDDAKKVRWLDTDENERDFKNLYSNHKMMVLGALKFIND